MSIKFRIPRYGGAGPALFGVQFKDTYILILSLLIAAVAGKFYGTPRTWEFRSRGTTSTRSTSSGATNG